MNQLSMRDLQTHVPILGWLLVAANAIFLAIGAFVFLLLTGIGLVSGEAEPFTVLILVAVFVAGLMCVLGIPGIVAGYGLLRHRQWGRILAMVIAVLSLANFPLGTIIGAYALWVLLQQSADEYFRSAG